MPVTTKGIKGDEQQALLWEEWAVGWWVVVGVGVCGGGGEE